MTEEAPNTATLTVADMQAMVGQEIGVSSWIDVDQSMIDQFADATGDKQWIHIDTERAAREMPGGSTIAHGYLTLSLLPVMSYELGGIPEGVHSAFNYGLDRLRFLTPVRPGSRVRLRSTLTGFDEKEPGRYLMRRTATVEIEGEDKPALVTDTLTLLVIAEAG